MRKLPFYLLKRENQESSAVYGLLCRELEIYLSRCHCAVKLRASCRMTHSKWANSRHVAQGLEHHLDMVGVGGSNPLVPTNDYLINAHFLHHQASPSTISFKQATSSRMLAATSKSKFFALKNIFSSNIVIFFHMSDSL